MPDVSSRVTTSATILFPPSPLWTPWNTRSMTCAHKHMITSNPTHTYTYTHTPTEPPRHTCASTSSWRARMGAKVPDHGQTSDSTCVYVCGRGDIYNEIIPCDLPHTPVQLPIHTHAHTHTHAHKHMTHTHTHTHATHTHSDVIPREPLARMSSSPPHHEQE